MVVIQSRCRFRGHCADFGAVLDYLGCRMWYKYAELCQLEHQFKLISWTSTNCTTRMHCLIGFMGFVTLLSMAGAAHVRAREEEPLQQQRGYQEQDTARKFYSYGYSDENAARAEYTTRDGSSRGFYSYVDANGKLQTVKYEAGGEQGFKAEASNLPKAPVDDKRAPLPVTDTAEVQQARQAHLEAIREAQQEQRQEQEQQQQLEVREEQRLQVSERLLSSEDAQILERVRAELTSMLAQRQREESRAAPALEEQQVEAAREAAREASREAAREASREAAREASREASREAAREAARLAALQAEAEQRDEARDKQREQAREQARERSGEQLQLQRAEDANDPRLRTVYTMEDLSSSSYLKLSDLQERLDEDTQQLRVPIGSYYSYESPSAKYSVTTPTKLRPIALSRSLLLSKSN